MLGTLHEDQGTFIIISQRILLKMGNLSDKSCRYNQNSCRYNQNTHFMFNNFYPKTLPFMRCEKKYAKTKTSHKRHNMEHSHCMLDN